MGNLIIIIFLGLIILFSFILIIIAIQKNKEKINSEKKGSRGTTSSGTGEHDSEESNEHNDNHHSGDTSHADHEEKVTGWSMAIKWIVILVIALAIMIFKPWNWFSEKEKEKENEKTGYLDQMNFLPDKPVNYSAEYGDWVYIPGSCKFQFLEATEPFCVQNGAGEEFYGDKGEDPDVGKSSANRKLRFKSQNGKSGKLTIRIWLKN